MINAYKAFWKRYFDFKGRTSRGNYWWAVLAQFIATFLVGFIAGMLDISALQTLWSLIILIPGIAMCVRRLHGYRPPRMVDHTHVCPINFNHGEHYYDDSLFAAEHRQYCCRWIRSSNHGIGNYHFDRSCLLPYSVYKKRYRRNEPLWYAG